MANSLKRRLKVGDKLVLDNGEICKIKTEGFGCSPVTSGTAIFVEDLHQTKEGRIGGYDIDANETMRVFGKENGWTE